MVVVATIDFSLIRDTNRETEWPAIGPILIFLRIKLPAYMYLQATECKSPLLLDFVQSVQEASVIVVNRIQCMIQFYAIN